MSATLYDKALTEKIRNWTKNTNIVITSPDETKRIFEYKADTTNDEPIQLPLITIRRNPRMTILNTSKQPMTFDGWKRIINSEKGSMLNGIPIQLNYSIDIYTRFLEEAEEYVRNFVYNIINYPKLSIEIPYNDSKYIHNANIILNADINDNSDIPERLIPGQFTRKTIEIIIDDAYLFDYRTKDTWRIEAEVKYE